MTIAAAPDLSGRGSQGMRREAFGRFSSLFVAPSGGKGPSVGSMKRWATLTVLVLLALPLPAGGLAAPSAPSTRTWNIYTTPIPARHGYKLAITVSKAAGFASVNFSFVKKRGVAKQEHNYFFKLRATDVSCQNSLSTCSVRTGTELGKFGKIKWKFRSKHRGKSVKPPSGCTGTDIDRAGTLLGSFDFRPGTAFFGDWGTRRRLSFNATGNTTTILCPVVVPICHTTQFSDFTSNAYVGLLARGVGPGSGSLSFAEPAATSAPASVSHLILFTKVPSGDFAFAPDLSSATFTSTGLPWISGGFAYTAGGPPLTSPSACGLTSYTTGSVNSNLSANLDGVSRRLSFEPTTTGFSPALPVTEYGRLGQTGAAGLEPATPGFGDRCSAN
jgi:hypothetical protein